MTGTAPRHPKYPHLLQPLEVAGMTMPNRSIMGSMHMGLEEEKDGFTKLAKFYAERAEGGAGLIVTGGISPNRAGKLALETGKPLKTLKTYPAQTLTQTL